MIFNINMPIKSYLKNYIVHSFQEYPVPISLKDNLGIVLFSLLEKPLHWRDDRYEQPKQYHKLDDAVTFSVPEAYTNLSGLTVSVTNQIIFNNYVDALFHKEFYFVTQSKQEKGMKIKDSILHFMEIFNLFDVIEYDTLKKAEYRHRLNLDKENFFTGCPFFLAQK